MHAPPKANAYGDRPVPQRVAVIAAMPMELRPLVRTLSLHQAPDDGPVRRFEGAAGTVEVVGIATGIGTQRARAATEALIASAEPDRVVCIGIAGALDREAEIGSLVVPEVVIDGDTGTELRPRTPTGRVAHGKLHTSDEFIVDPERLGELRAAGVVALDMETAAIGDVCERHGLPWMVLRAISDRATDYDPDGSVADLARPDGRPNVGAALRYMARRPNRIPRLMRLARGAKAAAENSVAAAVASLAQ